MQAYDEIARLISEKDYKLTPQRKTILKTILTRQDHHLSAEEIYDLVRRTNPEIGLATVYRTLELLADLGILQKLNFGDGRTRYEMGQNDVHRHHHLICTVCGRVTEFDDDLLETLETMVEKKTGFNIEDHEVKFFGQCQECRQKPS